MATQLSLYNKALGYLGERSLATLTDATEPRRVLDLYYADAVLYCLEQGQWKFAERYATPAAIAPPVVSYGLAKAFLKPTDFVRLNAVAAEVTFDSPPNKWFETGTHWYSDTTTSLHIQYVSKDAVYGLNLALWPESFADFVAYYLAVRAAPRLTPQLLQGVSSGQNEGETSGFLDAKLKQAFEIALTLNNVGGPPQYHPSGEPTKLSIFNNVMNLLGGRTLTRVTDATEPAAVLNGLWDHAREYCLEQGQWKFAERYASLTAITPPVVSYGLVKAFAKPTDFVRLNAVATEVTFDNHPDKWLETGTHWYSDTTTSLHIQYVSKDISYGYSLSLWPEIFVELITYYLAFKAAPRLAPQLMGQMAAQQEGETAGPEALLDAKLKQILIAAQLFNNVGGPPQYHPSGEPTKLSIFNEALGFLGLRTLTRATDASEPATVLNSVWDHAREYCLEQGHWNFAEKRELLTPSLTEIPTFGHRKAFAKPANYVRLSELCADEYFNAPVTQFDDRGAFWYCDLDQIYVGYVSKDSALGYNLSAWPQSFVTFVTLYLAVKAAPRLAPQMKQETIESNANIGLEDAKLNALSKDAVNGPTQFLPRGNWANSRVNRSLSPRNSRASLYGS